MARSAVIAGRRGCGCLVFARLVEDGDSAKKLGRPLHARKLEVGEVPLAEARVVVCRCAEAASA